jgi:tungstate transport system ATP-binding protein
MMHDLAMREHKPAILFEADRLSLEINGKRLLDHVSFSLPRGEMTAVIGPNGAGKSLLLRLCHGLIRPSSGHLKWTNGDGLTGNAVSDRSMHCAMVFQQPVMLRRSARANIEHGLSAIGMGRAESVQRAQAALERFGLSAFSNHPARLMSGGEQQRLAIARAWALSPKVIFLDEPCSQLDPGATRQIEDMLQALVADGMTMMMATHDLGQARRLVQNILFLHRGMLVESNTAEAFFAHPQSSEARRFIAGDLLW